MHSITGKLNKAARQFQAGESTGFGIRLGVKYRDRQTGQDEWTNYSAAIFAKSPNQIQFYQNVLVEGAIITVAAEKLKVDAYDGQNGQVLTIDLINAQLTFAHSPNAAPAQPQAPQSYNQAPQAPQGYQQQQAAPSSYQQVPHAQQQAPQQTQGHGGFDDDIAF